MIKVYAFLLGATALLSGCGSSAPAAANSVTNSMAANGNAIRLDPANMPPGLSASPLPMNGANIPGIPSNGAVLPKGTTPTPGIPSAEQLKKGMKPGLTPTPGIPDAETIRKAMSGPPPNINGAPPMMKSNLPMMKSNKRTDGRPQ